MRQWIIVGSAAAIMLVAGNPAAARKAAAAQTVSSLLKGASEQGGPSYATFRKVAIGEGWVPAPQPDCTKEVYGLDGPLPGKANICDALPEIESCSSNGLCLMIFQHKVDKRSLSVTTYGDYNSWDTPGEEGALYVQGGDIGR